MIIDDQIYEPITRREQSITDELDNVLNPNLTVSNGCIEYIFDRAMTFNAGDTLIIKIR